ncbi:SPOR domain-containing protein [Acinetobacter bouvetii]|uniref:Sporulation related domain protein n=1 Tax=Acinetobacter bouvetii TaxID=202951 RepID=A0A811GJS7_9GAMM|nr:SPOR domain-containing protein [Acinetobacter bouvetii]CAB1217196.1 Sporulation related domain protein [Acinetobacter bouvetii]
MNSKQRWMGGVVLLGGGVLLAALLLKGKEEIYQNEQKTPELAAQVEQKKPSAEGGMIQLQPLTVDVETEKRLLEEQRRAREKAVAEQEARAAEFLVMQQQAEADAARKAAEEYAALNAHRTGAQQSSDNIPPELVEDEKAKQKHLADEKLLAAKKLQQQTAQQRTDAEKKLAEDKRQAEAEKKLAEKRAAEKKAAQEQAKHEAELKRKADEKHEAEKKALEAKKKEQAKQEADAKKKAEAEKARDLLEHGDKQWMVQVALAANEANADALASKLRAKGYKVTKSPTSKGVRIMVGPSKDRDAADAARKKITGDASLGMKSAWVIDWVPLDKR